MIETELGAEMAKIREAYPWLEERTIEHFAREALKNKEANGHNKD